MHLLDFSHYSQVLHLDRRAWVALPSRTEGSELPVVLLLHHSSDSPITWLTRSNAMALADDLQAVLVAPSVDVGVYEDEARGYEVMTYLADELPIILSESLLLASEPGPAWAVLGAGDAEVGALELAARNDAPRFGAVGGVSLRGASYNTSATARARSSRLVDQGAHVLSAEPVELAQSAYEAVAELIPNAVRELKTGAVA